MVPKLKQYRALTGLLTLALILGAATVRAADSVAGDDVGWPVYGNDASDTHYSSLKLINTDNVKHLHAAYAVSTGTLRSNEATPLVIGDTMYLASSWGPRFVYALDAVTGEQKWLYKSNIPESVGRFACCDVASRGVAYADDRIFVGQLDGTLVALEAKTGKPIWKVTVVENKTGASITSPPLIVGDKVISGFAGGEYGARGYLSAYDAASGKLLWRTNTVPGPGERGNDSWKGDSWKHGGAAPWLVGSYDPKLNLIFFGTSNPGPYVVPVRAENKPHDKYANLYSSCVLALHPDTGKIEWYFQFTPADAWDYDGVNESLLVDLTVNNESVPVILHADRNGFFYVIDRRTGRLISVDTFANVTWAKSVNLESGQPDEVPGMRPSDVHVAKNICPSMLGGKNWHPMSYSPDTGLVYIPANNLCMNLQQEKKIDYHAGIFYLGIKDFDFYGGPGGFQSEVVAWNPLTRQRVWSSKDPLWFDGGTLATGGGLVFHGTIDGWFKALDAKTGEVLWKFRAGSGISAAPMTYEIGGKQYVAVVAGRQVTVPTMLGKIGAPIVQATGEAGMLFVFALD